MQITYGCFPPLRLCSDEPSKEPVAEYAEEDEEEDVEEDEHVHGLHGGGQRN